MDAKRFDQLARSLSAAGTRRLALRLLAAVPLAGSLAWSLDSDVTVAKRHRSGNKKKNQRRVGDEKQPHKPHCRRVKRKGHGHHGRRKSCEAHHGGKGKNKGHDKPKSCQPESLAQTCEGTCGVVQNNCKKTVDCGSCECAPACDICLTCDEETRQCAPDPAQVGDPCGDGLRCQGDGRCACQGDSCGGCRACEAGACVPDASVVCTPLDQCHDAGVCDPQTGACTNPPKSNGTSCNADNTSCTSGDSCQNGVCTPGAGVDCSSQNDECNRGVCNQADGACRKQPRQDGTPCGANGQCVAGRCEEVACLGLRESCDPSDNRCCADAACGEANCFETGDRCCHGLQGACSGDCDCCGAEICEAATDKCCSHTRGSCQSTADCCQRFFNRQACIAGKCCALPDEPCEGPDDCCEGLCDPEDSVCTGCFTLQRQCEDQSQCCQSGGATECGFSFDFETTNCCRPDGGTCQENQDCCELGTCCNGVCCGPNQTCVNNTCQAICRGHGQNCIDAPDLCCPGFECRSANFETVCRPVICLEFAEECWTVGARPCCTGECTTVIVGEAKSCCSPEGGECHDLGVFFPGGDCCGTNVCNGANQCARCRQVGESCDGFELPSTNNCCNTLDVTDPILRCVGGVCVQQG